MATAIRLRGASLILQSAVALALFLFLAAASWLSGRQLIAAAFALFAFLAVPALIRTGIEFRAEAVVVHSLFRSVVVPYADIVRSVVVLDPEGGPPIGLHVQRMSGPAVTINTAHLSRQAQHTVFTARQLRVEHHPALESLV